jgi:hypothetical protein
VDRKATARSDNSKDLLTERAMAYQGRLRHRPQASYRELYAAVDALAERVLDSDAPDVPADVRRLAN